MAEDCAFCKIVSGQIPCRKIYENKSCMVILDTAGDVDGHMLVIPKVHAKNIFDCDQKVLHEIMDTVKLVSEHLNRNCGYEGVNLLHASDESAGQSVPHFHLHIIPRKGGDRIDAWPHFEGARRTEDEMYDLLKFSGGTCCTVSRGKMDLARFAWTREPANYKIGQETIEIVTKPHTDLWQRTYYHFRNDNAPVLQMETEEAYFSFVVKTEFWESHHRFDQCGIVMYLDSENWLKASVEYENEEYQHLGSVVTNNGYSDWATTEISASVKVMWYRFSRREDDYCIECSADGVTFRQMRICHMHAGTGKIRFGIYACSPEESSFKAVFSDMQMTDCQWKAHDGQQPDVHF